MMLSTDFWNLERLLWAVRYGNCRTDISFDTGRVLGYLSALQTHALISDDAHARLDSLLSNAQQFAMAVVYDLEVQGWSE